MSEQVDKFPISGDYAQGFKDGALSVIEKVDRMEAEIERLRAEVECVKADLAYERGKVSVYEAEIEQMAGEHGDTIDAFEDRYMALRSRLAAAERVCEAASRWWLAHAGAGGDVDDAEDD